MAIGLLVGKWSHSERLIEVTCVPAPWTLVVWCALCMHCRVAVTTE
jgi:hypothetical protein